MVALEYPLGRSSRPFVLLLLTSLPLTGAAAATQLFIDQQPVSADRVYRGTVDLAVAPPFEDASVRISIDGHRIADGLRRPYRTSFDLGPTAVEHIIDVLSTTAQGTSESWRVTINPGSKPMEIKVRPASQNPRVFDAAVTVPRGEGVLAVEFYDEQGLIGRAAAPPWRIALPERSSGSIVTATAKLQSGGEVTDIYAGDESVHSASYDVRTVQVMVSISDRHRSRSVELPQTSFEVLDKGTRARILDIRRADEQPISIAMLVDSSASITPEIEGVGRAAANFVKSLIRAQDRCAVFAVTTTPRREQPLTSNVKLVQQALKSLRPGGRTALYDSIRAALRELHGADTRKAIVILTDGEDTSSMSDFEEILQQVKLAAVPVYVISFNESSDYEKDRDRLRFLTSESGGFLVSATNQNLEAKYREIERDLREQYAIKYQVTDAARANEWRDVKVVVKEKDVVARTIRGYFTP